MPESQPAMALRHGSFFSNHDLTKHFAVREARE